jgi:hypothetical protein
MPGGTTFASEGYAGDGPFSGEPLIEEERSYIQDRWNHAAEKVGRERERLTMLDRWSMDGRNRLPRDVAQKIHREYLNVVPFPERLAEEKEYLAGVRESERELKEAYPEMRWEVKDSSTEAKHGRDEENDEESFRPHPQQREEPEPVRTVYPNGSVLTEYFDRDGRPHRRDGPAWIAEENGRTQQQYYTHGELGQLEPGSATYVTSDPKGLMSWQHPTLPPLTSALDASGNEYWYVTGKTKFRVKDTSGAAANDHKEVQYRKQRWNDAAGKAGKQRERLSMLDRWSANGRDTLPTDIAGMIHEEYLNWVPFPELNESRTQRRKESRWEQPGLPTLVQGENGVFSLDNGNTDPRLVDEAKDQWNNAAIRAVEPQPQQSGTQGKATDVDDDIQLTINAIELLPQEVHKIHGCFARMVYSYQQEKVPAASSTKESDDDSEDEPSESEQEDEPSESESDSEASDSD